MSDRSLKILLIIVGVVIILLVLGLFSITVLDSEKFMDRTGNSSTGGGNAFLPAFPLKIN